MKHVVIAALFAASSVVACATAAQADPTINVIVVQEDWDPSSVARNSRIQNAVLTEFSQSLHAPAHRSIMARHGIDGMDVYDETSLTLDFYGQDRQRRTDQELISIARDIDLPKMDVVVPYTLYAATVRHPYTGVPMLQVSMNYRALNVRDGRYLGGDNIDLDTSGLPFTGCAARLGRMTPDRHCVDAFISEHSAWLARAAGDKLAIQLASMLGTANPVALAAAPVQTPHITPVQHVSTQGGCQNMPATYRLTFRGFEARQINAIEQSMSFWNCVMDTNVTQSGFTEITFSYKTRADEQRMLRNIRLMSQMMGVVTEARLVGSNGFVVEAVNLRTN